MLTEQEVKLFNTGTGEDGRGTSVLPTSQPVRIERKEDKTEEVLNTNDLDQTVIPVIEEFLKVDKKIVETGKVHISKVVYEDVNRYTIPYTEEHINVERIPKNEFVETMPPAVRYDGDVMIIPVLKEVAVVEKKIMLVEELRITKSKVEKNEFHEVTLRKEEVEINRTEPGVSI